MAGSCEGIWCFQQRRFIRRQFWHEEAIRYRETRFDALLFLGRICAMAGKYIQSEATFARAEQYVGDSPYEWKLPLCPEEIREKAEEQKKRQE